MQYTEYLALCTEAEQTPLLESDVEWQVDAQNIKNWLAQLNNGGHPIQ